MRKLSFILAATTLVIVFAAVGAAQAPKPIVLKIQSSFTSGTDYYDNLRMFAEMVEKAAGGRLKIEHLPGGAIVGAFDVLDATSRGVIDGAHTWPGYWFGKHPASLLFPGGFGGPFGMDFTDWFGWMYEGGGFDLYQEFYRDVLRVKVVAFPIIPFSPQLLGWFKQPIKSVEDFKRLKIRGPGHNALVWKELGASVVILPGGEILPAAERGLIDGAEWGFPSEDLRLGMHQVFKHYYMPNVNETQTVGELLINRDVWSKLPADLQEIVRISTVATSLRFIARSHTRSARVLKEDLPRLGVQVHRTPDDLLRRFLDVAQKVVEREAAKDPFFKKVLESQRQYASVVVPARRLMFPSYDFVAEYYYGKK